MLVRSLNIMLPFHKNILLRAYNIFGKTKNK